MRAAGVSPALCRHALPALPGILRESVALRKKVLKEGVFVCTCRYSAIHGAGRGGLSFILPIILTIIIVIASHILTRPPVVFMIEIYERVKILIIFGEGERDIGAYGYG